MHVPTLYYAGCLTGSPNHQITGSSNHSTRRGGCWVPSLIRLWSPGADHATLLTWSSVAFVSLFWAGRRNGVLGLWKGEEFGAGEGRSVKRSAADPRQRGAGEGPGVKPSRNTSIFRKVWGSSADVNFIELRVAVGAEKQNQHVATPVFPIGQRSQQTIFSPIICQQVLICIIKVESSTEPFCDSTEANQRQICQISNATWMLFLMSHRDRGSTPLLDDTRPTNIHSLRDGCWDVSHLDAPVS